MKIILQGTQVALMFQNSFTGSFDGVLSSYQETYPGATGNKIPLPDDFPEDSIPRLEIVHVEKKITVRFAKNRADIFFESEFVDEGILRDYLARVIEFGVTVGRVGYVQKHIYSDIDFLYIRSKLNALSAVEADMDILEAAQRVNRKAVIELGSKTIVCNNIASLTFGKKDSNPALLLERDVNTKQDKNLSLKNLNEVEELVALLKGRVEETLFEMQ